MGTFASVRALGAGLVAVAFVLAPGCADRGGPGLTYANYEKIDKSIRDGKPMTEEEINKLLDSKGVTELEFVGAQAAKSLGKLGEEIAKAGKTIDAIARRGTGPFTMIWGTVNRHVKCVIENGKVKDVEQKGL
jgi:hypothetical protein